MTEPDQPHVPTDYYSKQAISFLPRVLTTVIVILATVSGIMYLAVGREAAMGVLIVLGFFVVTGLVLSKITVEVSSGIMTLKFGPFRDILDVDDIKTIRIVEVNPMSIYHGYGKRVGKDGSTGYIAAGDKGVRIEMNGGKVFVITLDDPHELLAVVKKNQDNISYYSTRITELNRCL